MPMDLRQGFRLGDCAVWPEQGCIMGPDGPEHVEPKVMELLVYLALHAGTVCGRTAIIDDVWDGPVEGVHGAGADVARREVHGNVRPRTRGAVRRDLDARVSLELSRFMRRES